ncbi:MAG: hypothetical protein H0V74_01300 [Chloroflexi bacterium]|nr:hypothetical protein [Chloroflexota bacterium]
MADFPIDLDDGLADRLVRVLDVEGKIPGALEALGPVADRDVLLLDGSGGLRAGQLRELGARVEVMAPSESRASAVADASADVLVAFWSSFRGVEAAEMEEAARIVRPGGRLLVVHDYGRDDVSALRGDLPDYGPWSRRDGPFLRSGFKIRVVHCWWTFESLDDARQFLGEAFGEVGTNVGSGLTRPRLSYNVAVYHRTLGEPSAV